MKYGEDFGKAQRAPGGFASQLQPIAAMWNSCQVLSDFFKDELAMWISVWHLLIFKCEFKRSYNTVISNIRTKQASFVGWGLAHVLPIYTFWDIQFGVCVCVRVCIIGKLG